MKKYNSPKNIKLLNIVLLSLTAGVTGSLLTGCNSGKETTNQSSQQQSANNSMIVGLKSSFITKNPLVVGQKYTLVTSDVNGAILSNQSISCDNLEFCQVKISGLDNASSDQIYLRILDDNGGLIAAQSLQLYQYIQGVNQVNNTPIVFSEVSTGNYILDKMSQAGFTIISGYNGDIEDDVADTLDLENDRHPEVVLPTAAYIAVQKLGADKSEASGILRFWYSIYGDNSDDGSELDYSSSNILATNKLGINYSDINTLMGALSEANSNAPSNLNQSNISTQAADKSTLASPIIDKDVVEAARVAAAQVLKATTHAQVPANKEQQQNLKIVKGVLSAAFNAINLAAPGVGSVLNFSSSTLLDYFYPETKSDPNSAVINGLKTIDDSINNYTKLYTDNKNDENLQSLYTIQAEIQGLSKSLISKSNTYIGLLKSGEGLAKNSGIKINYDDPNFIYGSLLDDYVTYNQINKTNALKEVAGLFNDSLKAENIINLVEDVSQEAKINKFMKALNMVRANKIASLNTSINDPSQVNYGEFDLIQIDEGYYATILDLETSIIRALDKTRNLQLGAAYLKMKSKYKNELGPIYISEEASYIDYETTAEEINKKYEDKMQSVIKIFNKNFASGDTISKAKAYYESNFFEIAPGKTRPKCNITYWDGVNLETRCRDLRADGTDILERISNVALTCGPTNKIKLHETRLYCEAQLVDDVTMPKDDRWLKYANTNVTGTRLYIDNKINVLKIGPHTTNYICPANTRYCIEGQRVSGFGYKDMSKDTEFDYSTRLETMNGSKFAFMSKGEIRSWSWIDMRNLWASLGCITSDCKVIADSQAYWYTNKDKNKDYKTQQIYFSGGDLVSLKTRDVDSNYVNAYDVEVSSSTERPLPSGKWPLYCENSAILQNGVLTARCSNIELKNAHDNSIRNTSSLNLDKQCQLGSPVEVDGKGNLKCKNPK